MTENEKSKVQEEFQKALEEMKKKENVNAFIFLTMDKANGETAKGQCIVSGSLFNLAKLYNSVDKNVKTTAAIVGLADTICGIPSSEEIKKDE